MIKPEINLSIDDVLKGKGANPIVVADHKPGLLKVAQTTLEIWRTLIHPESFSKMLEIIFFENGEIFY